MSETSTESVASRPRHALRRHPTGRYVTGLIPVAALIKQYQPADTARRGRRPIVAGRGHPTEETE